MDVVACVTVAAGRWWAIGRALASGVQPGERPAPPAPRPRAGHRQSLGLHCGHGTGKDTTRTRHSLAPKAMGRPPSLASMAVGSRRGAPGQGWTSATPTPAQELPWTSRTRRACASSRLASRAAPPPWRDSGCLASGGREDAELSMHRPSCPKSQPLGTRAREKPDGSLRCHLPHVLGRPRPRAGAVLTVRVGGAVWA